MWSHSSLSGHDMRRCAVVRILDRPGHIYIIVVNVRFYPCKVDPDFYFSSFAGIDAIN